MKSVPVNLGCTDNVPPDGLVGNQISGQDAKRLWAVFNQHGCHGGRVDMQVGPKLVDGKWGLVPDRLD